MVHPEFNMAMVDTSVLDMLRSERAKALSAREWKFRLAGYGYGITQIGARQMVTKLPQGTPLGMLPADLGA
jgi:hypothetical protein